MSNVYVILKDDTKIGYVGRYNVNETDSSIRIYCFNDKKKQFVATYKKRILKKILLFYPDGTNFEKIY